MYNKIVTNSKLKHVLFKIFAIGILIFPSILSAESQILIQEGEINFEMIPENPEPYEEVAINLYSYATDLDKAVISWVKNNENISSGIGKKNISIISPGPNSSIVLDITIVPAGQTSSIRKNIVISPSDMNILWESIDGYAPPFYKGKTLPSRGGVIKVVSIPNTNSITSSIGEMDYTWKNNDTTVENASGYNKNSYVFKNSLFSPEEKIEVSVSSVSGNYNSTRKITIPTYNPLLIFYKKSPTDGILYNNGILGEFNMEEDQATFVAAPYNLAIGNNDNLFNYTWYVNDEATPTPVKNEISIRPTSRGGYVEIGLRIENLQELFQKVTNFFNVNL